MTVRRHDRFMEGNVDVGATLAEYVGADLKFVTRCITVANDAVVDPCQFKLELVPSSGPNLVVWTKEVGAGSGEVLPILMTLYDGDGLLASSAGGSAFIIVSGVFYYPA